MKIPTLLAVAVTAAAAMIGCEGQNMHYQSTNSKPMSGEVKAAKNGHSDKQVAKAEKKGEYNVKAKKGGDDDDEEEEKEHKHKKKQGDSTNKKQDEEKKKVASTTSKPAKGNHHDEDDDEDEEEDD